MGKRPAEVESFVGNMGSIQWEDTAFYAKRRIASHGNETRTNSSRICCEPTSEERSAGNPHATFRGSRRRVTASGDPVLGEKSSGATRPRMLLLPRKPASTLGSYGLFMNS